MKTFAAMVLIVALVLGTAFSASARPACPDDFSLGRHGGCY